MQKMKFKEDTHDHVNEDHHHDLQESKQSQIKAVQKPQQNYWKSFITGGLSGIFAKTVIAPIERVKLLYVTRQQRFSYTQAFQDIKFIYRNHGFWNFYRGNAANVIRVFPFASINFSVFDYLRNNFWKPCSEDQYILKRLILFLCGAVSGMTATTITYPLEFVRTRLAMEKNNFKYKNVFQGIQIIQKQEGILSLYSGWSTAMFGVFTYHGFAFYCVNTIKTQMLNKDKNTAKKWYFDFAIGGFASALGQSISYPIDIVRKRMQGQQFLIMHKEQDRKYNTRQMIRFIFETEGLRGFYKGLSVNLIKGPLSTGTAWTIKNKLNRAVDKAYDF